MRTVLTIAGFDPSGGAGILADIKTIAAFGCYGAAAITSITSQNTMGVFETFHQPPHILAAQLEPIFDDFTISATKIGMLPETVNIDLIVETLERRNAINIVVDPVIRSTSGFDLIDNSHANYLMTRLFPIADLITPNIAEAQILAQMSITNLDEMKIAATNIHNESVKWRNSKNTGHSAKCSVLVKGGDLAKKSGAAGDALTNNAAVDVLYDGIEFREFSSEKVASRNTHGTGCTLSSGIAALMAMDVEIPNAIEKVKEYIVAAIKNAPNLGHGHGPLNHQYGVR